jgi:hypothetical protein
VSAVELDEEPVERFAALRVADGSWDEVATELVDGYEAGDPTLLRSGD